MDGFNNQLHDMLTLLLQQCYIPYSVNIRTHSCSLYHNTTDSYAYVHLQAITSEAVFTGLPRNKGYRNI